MRAVGEGFRHTAFCLDDASSVEAFFRHDGIETGRWARRAASYRLAPANASLYRPFSSTGQ
jgi:hypothetical protein